MSNRCRNSNRVDGAGLRFLSLYIHIYKKKFIFHCQETKYILILAESYNLSPATHFPLIFVCYVHLFTNGSVDHGVLSFYMIYLNVIEHCYLILVSTVCIYSK